MEVTLAEVQEDLKNRPPQVLTLEEVQLTNGAANGHVEQVPESGKNQEEVKIVTIYVKSV